MLCVIVLLGTLALTFAVFVSTLILICLLCKKEFNDASNKNDAEKTEFGLENDVKEP